MMIIIACEEQPRVHRTCSIYCTCERAHDHVRKKAFASSEPHVVWCGACKVFDPQPSTLESIIDNRIASHRTALCKSRKNLYLLSARPLTTLISSNTHATLPNRRVRGKNPIMLLPTPICLVPTLSFCLLPFSCCRLIRVNVLGVSAEALLIHLPSALGLFWFKWRMVISWTTGVRRRGYAQCTVLDPCREVCVLSFTFYSSSLNLFIYLYIFIPYRLFLPFTFYLFFTPTFVSTFFFYGFTGSLYRDLEMQTNSKRKDSEYI